LVRRECLFDRKLVATLPEMTAKHAKLVAAVDAEREAVADDRPTRDW